MPFLTLARTFGLHAEAEPNNRGAKAHLVRAGADASGEAHKNPWAEAELDYKVLTSDTGGGLFVMEHRNLPQGGPRRHRHFGEDEWFYLLEGGNVVIEIGDERFALKPGDSILAPKTIPHVWAYIGDKAGRMLIGFAPANKMEAMFTDIGRRGHPLLPDEMRPFGIEVVGPALDISKL